MKTKRLLCVLLLSVLCLLLCRAPALGAALPDERASKALDFKRLSLGLGPGDNLLDALSPLAGTTAGDWTAMGDAFFTDDGPAGYLRSLAAGVKRAYRESGTLSETKATEYHRQILLCLALGGDPRDVDGVDLVADGIFLRENLNRQGVNADIFALLALSAYPFEAPESAVNTKDGLLSSLLSRQNPDGGWSMAGEKSEPDLTAMALAALSFFLSPDDAALSRALDCLSAMQEENGGFRLYGLSNCESAAWAVIALTSLGLDPEKDPRFLKNGRSSVDALLSFQLEDGGFAHDETGSGADAEMPLSQALLALAALRRFREEGRRLFDFSGKTLVPLKAGDAPEKTPARVSPLADPKTRRTAVSSVLVLAVLSGTAALLLRGRKRRKEAGV